ncbi:septation ring formation regulator EzrA [Virgibacillus alimentarius]|uniref:septation ring formation regulator EzrA n=1 Tax=Virgibacillus alimentarius TaxID=698769 RepID=UPI0004935E49|nr:septation ring formation regulator EzrA [Virgibacillus alimentarius]
MAYIIGIILLIIALIIVGLILRKRVYDEVDQQENWKMDILDRDVAAELSKIKKLNLSGETQEKFESWKERWEIIITKELSNVEDMLVKAEEFADRYRFSNAKKLLRKNEQDLNTIENDIEKILNELEELLESEKSSREDVETLRPNIKYLRRKLSQHRYQYGKAESVFESRIDEMEQAFIKYDELAGCGNYFEAKDLVNNLKQELEQLISQIDEFPEIYRKCKHDLPAQLDELLTGLKEMKSDGYRVSHLGLKKEIHDYQKRLLDGISSLEKGNISEVKILIEEIENRILEMYQLLEKEAIAKSYMEAKIPKYQSTLDELGASFYDTKTEVENMKKAYYFEDSDMERYLALDKTIAHLEKQLEEFSNAMENENIAHSELRERLDEGFQQMAELQEKHEAFKKRIHNLRKDEIEAKETLAEIQNNIYDTNRKLKKSNIPGVPNFIWNMMETAAGKNKIVMKALEKQPLEIAEVQQALTEAKLTVDKTMEQTDLLLEQAALTEQVIQYANRYRSSYPELAAKLNEAERLFRSFEYELALEQAANAVEEIEPGALQKIEVPQEVLN